MFDRDRLPREKKGDDLNTLLVDLAGNVRDVRFWAFAVSIGITSLQVPAFNSTEARQWLGSYLNTEQHETLHDIPRTQDNASHGERDPQRM
jgi:hypothetical protein